MQERALRCLTALIYGAAALGAAWLTLRFLLPWSAPFLLSALLAALLEKPMQPLLYPRTNPAAQPLPYPETYTPRISKSVYRQEVFH